MALRVDQRDAAGIDIAGGDGRAVRAGDDADGVAADGEFGDFLKGRRVEHGDARGGEVADEHLALRLGDPLWPAADFDIGELAFLQQVEDRHGARADIGDKGAQFALHRDHVRPLLTGGDRGDGAVGFDDGDRAAPFGRGDQPFALGQPQQAVRAAIGIEPDRRDLAQRVEVDDVDRGAAIVDDRRLGAVAHHRDFVRLVAGRHLGQLLAVGEVVDAERIFPLVADQQQVAGERGQRREQRKGGGGEQQVAHGTSHR